MVSGSAKMRIAKALVRPFVTAHLGSSKGQEAKKPAGEDQVSLNIDTKEGAVRTVAEGIGALAGAAAGTVVVAVTAAVYPAAALAVGTATGIAVLQSQPEPGSVMENKLARVGAAVGLGVLAGIYAPIVAGAVTAVAVEEVATPAAEKVLTQVLAPPAEE